MQLLLILALSLTAWAGPDYNPKKSHFRKICREHRAGAADFYVEAPEAGMKSYFPILAFEATQTRFSFSRFLHSLAKVARAEDGEMNYDRGRSLYGMEKKVRAVHYRGKLYVIDGHHRLLISTYLGAKTIATEIVDDFSDLSPAKFRAKMERKGYSYWRNFRNQPVEPVDLCDMDDDANFQLARLLILRVDAKIQSGELTIGNPRGPDRPIAVKINSDIPFLEIHIADALRRGDVEYDDSRPEDDFSKEELQEYADILQGKARAKSSPLAKVLLLDKPRDVAKLDLEQIVFNHMRHKSCEKDLE